MKVWVVTGRSESGDDYGPWVYSSKPSEKFLKQMLKENFPDEFDDDGCLIYLNKPEEVYVEDIE